jgi:hypothetical protein
MKKHYLSFKSQITFKLSILFVLFGFFVSNAQVTTNSGSGLAPAYPDLASAITALNGAVISSPIVITLTGNETAPAGGYSITAQGDAVNTIIIEGVTSTITANAALTVGALNDAIFKLVGADYITIQGFTMLENPANTITAAATNNMTEWGVALLYATTSNGSQNNTIQINTIDLNRTYQNTFGIYCNATHAAATPTTSATAIAGGGNSGLKVYTNSITDVNIGILVVGPTAAADHNDGIDIGGAALATGNTITNYGTTGTFSGYVNVSGTVNGILVRNSKNFNVSFNSVTSSNGGVTAGTLNGIQVQASSNTPTGSFTNTINNNSISLRSGVITGAMNGITYPSGSATATSTLSINNNDFNNFGHTVAGTAAIIFIATNGTDFVKNINNNTFTNISVNTTGSVTFISHGASMIINATHTISNNAIVTAFAKTGAGGTVTGLTSGTSSVNGSNAIMTNNNFSNITVSGATAITGISNSDGAGTSPNRTVTGNVFNNWTGGTSGIIGMTFTYIGANSTISNNTITNISGQGAITGLTIGNTFAGGNPLNVANNTVTNLVSSGTGGTVIGIACSSTSPIVNISVNAINTLSSTGASAVSGIVISGANAAGTNVFKNKIYDLSGSNVSSTVNGLLISGGALVTAYNNIIGDLRTPIANAANPLNGINITGGTNVNAYYNTVLLNGSSAGALFGSSAVSASSTPTVTLRNNIFVNNSTVTGAGLATAYRRSTTTLTTYTTASNNNLFFGSTIFTDGTNTDLTLVDFKIRMATRDAGSVTENPNFLSTTGSNIDFLHIDPSIATQIESAAVQLAGITDDFDGNVRNVSTPDIGADEFAGIIADITGPTIVHTVPLSSCGQGTAVISATITDLSGVPTLGAGLPVAYWRINAGAYSAATATSMGAGVYEFSIGTGSVLGDIVSYYIVAQDNVGTPNVSVLPAAGASGFTSSPPAVSTPPTTPFSYNVVAPLNGVYTVGVAGNYATLTAAIADYNIKCITGPVTFDLIDATYPSETYPITIQSNLAASSVNTLTIKPATGVTATISGSNAAAIIKINGADYVTIDGSNSGSSSRDLTINNTNTVTTSAVLWNGSANASNGALNNTFKNLNILGNAPLTTFVGIFSGSGTTMGNPAESANNNFIANNNSLAKSQYGIAIAGAASGNTGNVISYNVIGSNTLADYIGFIGVFASNNNGIQIRNNIVYNIITTSTNPIGMNIAANVTNALIDSNDISSIVYTGTTGYGGKGLNINTGTATSNITVSNNMISNLRGDGWSALGGDSTVGIRIGATGGTNVTTGGIKLYNNTVNLGSGTFAGNATGTRSAALYLSSVTSNLDIRNNIFTNNLVNSNAAAAKNYTIYSDAANTAFTSIDYNDYAVSGTQGVLGFLTSDRATLADIQTGFGQNVNSLNVLPVYISATDLHLDTNTNTALDNKGIVIATVTLDIDEDPRSAAAPDMGADEFDSIACTSAVGGTASALVTSFCGSGSTTVSATGYSTDVATMYQWQSSVDLVFTTPVNIGTASATYADLTTPTLTSTTYYRLAVTCSENGATSYSTVVTITVNALPNNATTQSGDTLTATETGATYQWVTCSAGPIYTPIGGETSQSYLVTAIGSYAVEVTKNGCTLRSACVDVTSLSTDSFNLNALQVYPNPVINTLSIRYTEEITTISVYDLSGRLVKQVTPNQTEAQVDMSELAAAMYIVKVNAGGNQTEIKVIKK